MNHLNKAINMILRGDLNKFKNIIEESLVERTTIMMESLYKQESKNVLNNVLEITNFKVPVTEQKQEQFVIPQSYTTKDGKSVSLTEEQINNVSKLYKNLNNNSRERLVRLLYESEESLNRIINLAKIERNKKNVK